MNFGPVCIEIVQKHELILELSKAFFRSSYWSKKKRIKIYGVLYLFNMDNVYIYSYMPSWSLNYSICFMVFFSPAP